MGIFSFEKEQKNSISDEIMTSNMFGEKIEGSKLGIQLSNLVRNDEEYAKFNKYMK